MRQDGAVLVRQAVSTAVPIDMTRVMGQGSGCRSSMGESRVASLRCRWNCEGACIDRLVETDRPTLLHLESVSQGTQ